MLKLANILYKDELINHTKVDFINYVPTQLHDFDKEIPKLFVGWNYLKEWDVSLFSDLSILNKEISKNIAYWEFSFNENKAQHVGGVEMFVRNAPYFYFNANYKYKNIDPIFDNIQTISEIQNILPNKIDYYYIYKDEMLYVLSDKKIYGINLKMFEFFTITDEYSVLNTIPTNVPHTRDLDGSIYQKHYKTFPFFEDLKRYLVVLLSKA